MSFVHIARKEAEVSKVPENIKRIKFCSNDTVFVWNPQFLKGISGHGDARKPSAVWRIKNVRGYGDEMFP